MKILALILARGGSKRLPGKNIRMLGGKPLIVWSIDIVKGVVDICDILVSTDDSKIADICVENGAFVPWLRPKGLATDDATSVDAALHAVDFYERKKGAVDGLLLLQPTSPFRAKDSLNNGIKSFRERFKNPVIGVSPATNHPMWTLKLENETIAPFFSDGGFCVNSQSLPAAYVVNGGFYLIAPEDLRKYRSFFVPGAVPLLVQSPIESLDIDTEWDFQMAEMILEKGLYVA